MSFTPVLLSQQDPRWKDENLGFDNSITIGTDGCALTCLTMLVNGYGFSETPSTMNKKLKDMGDGNGFLGGLIVWGGLTRAFPRIVFQRLVICRDQAAPLDAINTSLDSGQPLVVEVDRSPSPGLQNHWVVLTARQGDDYLMLDPWPQPPDNAPVSLAGRFAFGRPLDQVITAVAWYQASGQAATTPSSPATIPTTPAPGSGLLVRVQASMTAGLRLRSAPTTTSSTVTIEAAGTQLRCLEPDAAVLSKIGITDQWLQVSDPGGATGYIAAWYVEKMGDAAPAPAPTPAPAPPPEPAPAPAPAPVPPPASTGLTVLVSQSVGGDGLRMRAQANTSSSIVTVEPAGAELSVIELEAEARPKIGQQNQWLNVRDGSGNTGYVAAWYVELKPGSISPDTKPSAAPASSSGNQTPVTPAPSVPSASAALTVVISSQVTAGLRLRVQPNASANTIKILPAGTSLTVLEAASAAQAKIGVNGQWLNVKEPGGQAGYVSARYVQK